ncbi:glycosyltransferase family 2 protein [Algoriphagus taiwanensis]|uniref:Glycosyltransferase family 2 protein n=1 Tax=Algoriphagus taiwanensis TaxID=1445656 RepID=A0ABQ6Q0V2_9BACT|nr:glycosyltransferase family 2 protein [Algoriphagus taiwanensis]
MNTFLILILSLPIAYLTVASFYQLVLALASRRYKSPKLGKKSKGRTLILVPAYREDAVILSSTEVNLKRIPQDNSCDYLVLADQLQAQTVAKLRAMGAEVLEVKFEKSTKVKSLKAGMDFKAGKGDYWHTVILDADNILDRNFISTALQYRALGYRVLQGERLASNTRNAMEILDGLSEKANQELLCKGANQLGLSSKLTGSAMVLDFDLFKLVLRMLKAIGGFDKEMELILTAMGETIQYAPELKVWDEKVSSTQAFAKQRGRWLESQYTFLRKSIQPATRGLFRGNKDYFHKSIQLALPPRVLAPAALLLFLGISILLSFNFLVGLAGVSFVALMASYFIVLPTGLWKRHFTQILLALPGLVLAAIQSLGWMKKSKKEFLHTAHQFQKS